MKKRPQLLSLVLHSMALLFPWCLSAQSLFTKITDPDNPLVSFVNTAAGYKGCVWIDLDHDQWPDAFVSQKFLFRNLHNGNFERLSDLNGATLGQAAAGSSWGDFDNDGDLDCITASTVSGLHYNKGDNTFDLLNAQLPDFSNYRAWDCAVADADNNGRLDLFFAHADGFPPGSVQQPCKFYLQNTDGSFALVSGYEFASQFQPYTIPIWTDFDLDGDQDLFIGTGPGGSPGPDFCYRNMLKETGNFSLQKLTNPPFNQLQDGQVYNTVDFDNDGDFDLCLTNYAGAKTRFYVNQQNNFVETATPFTLQGQYLTNAWGDMDNDGHLDVLITRDASAAVSFYRNLGNAFEAAQTAGEVSANGNACGIALADYDNDGDLDFYVNGGGEGRSLFSNDNLAAGRNWAAFTLQGVASNRSAIGALIRLKADIGAGPVWQIREVSAHNSFQSQSDLRQHFGLNHAQSIDSLEVRWPSGLVQRFGNLVPDMFYSLQEGQPLNPVLGASEAAQGIQLGIRPNPAGQDFAVISEAPILALEMFDSTGRIIPVQWTPDGDGAHVKVTSDRLSGSFFVRVRLRDGRTTFKQILLTH